MLIASSDPFWTQMSPVQLAAGDAIRPGPRAIPVTAIPGLSSFCNHVGHVGVVGAEPEVGVIDACGIVARWAIMQHLDTDRDRPVLQTPSGTMCAFAATICREEVAVAVFRETGSPRPTRIGATNCNLLPETIRFRPGRPANHLTPRSLIIALFCRYYIPLEGSHGADWGACSGPLSEYDGRVVFEHWTCTQFRY